MTCNLGGPCEDKRGGECASDGPGSAKGEGMAHTLPNEKCPTCGELAQQVPGDVRLVCDVWVCEKCNGAWPSEGAGNNLTKQLAALKDELARASGALDDARRLAIRLNAFLGHEPRDCAMVDSLAGELLAALAGAGGAAMSCENCERLKDENERAREALRQQTAALIHVAQNILEKHLHPDGPDQRQTLLALYGLFDGPEQRRIATLVSSVIAPAPEPSCNHERTEMRHDVGYDIDCDGEENQHLEICLDCHAERMHCEHTKHGKSVGAWMLHGNSCAPAPEPEKEVKP